MIIFKVAFITLKNVISRLSGNKTRNTRKMKSFAAHSKMIMMSWAWEEFSCFYFWRRISCYHDNQNSEASECGWQRGTVFILQLLLCLVVALSLRLFSIFCLQQEMLPTSTSSRSFPTWRPTIPRSWKEGVYSSVTPSGDEPSVWRGGQEGCRMFRVDASRQNGFLLFWGFAGLFLLGINRNTSFLKRLFVEGTKWIFYMNRHYVYCMNFVMSSTQTWVQLQMSNITAVISVQFLHVHSGFREEAGYFLLTMLV